MHPIGFLFQFLVHLPLVEHFFRGVVEPPELEVQIVAELIQHKVNLHILAQDQEPRLIFVAFYGGEFADVGALNGFELADQVLGGAVQVATTEAARHDSVRFLAIPEFVQLYDLYVFHLVDFAKSDKFGNSGQLAFLKENLVVIFGLLFVYLGSETPHEVFLWPFD